MGFGDLAGARIGAHVPVDVEHRGLLGAGLEMTTGHRGDPVAGLARRGEQPDLAADRVDLRRPVQTEHPAQRDRVDPGRCLDVGFTQQGPEHGLAQHRIQRVERGAELAVDLMRGVDQPGRDQRGQCQCQPRQRCPRARGEHRRRTGDQPGPRQYPLARPRHRIGQHRRLHHRRCRHDSESRRRTIILGTRIDLRLWPYFDLRLLLLRQWIIGTGWGARLVAVSVGAGVDRPERVADTARRHPHRGGDAPVGRPTRPQPADRGDRVGCELRLAFGTFALGEQPGHTGVAAPGLPAPQCGRIHRECRGDLQLGGGLDAGQRHRREPAPRGIARVPGVGQIAAHVHPAAVVVLDDRRGRADRPGTIGHQRQRRLRGHHGYDPLPAMPRSGCPVSRTTIGIAGATAAARRASSLNSAGLIECCGAAPTSVGPTRTASCSWSRSARAGTTSGGRVAGAGRLARTAANWRPVSRFSPAHTSLPSRSSL